MNHNQQILANFVGCNFDKLTKIHKTWATLNLTNPNLLI